MPATVSFQPARAALRSHSRLAELRSPWLIPLLAGASVLTFAALLYLTGYKNFYYDEWDFVTSYRPGEATSILLPHNEHWSTLAILIWQVLFRLFGIRSHVPYEAAALLAHIACVAVLFLLIRRRSGQVPAFAAALVLLVLGTGATNIVFAFQLTWTLSIALGLLALLAVDMAPHEWSWRHALAISVLLLASLMSSGLGLGFVAAVVVQLTLERGHRTLLACLALPVGAYIAWFLAFGAGAAPCPGCASAIGDIRSMSPGRLVEIVQYAAYALAGSAAGIVGLVVADQPPVIRQVCLVALAALLGWHWYAQGGTRSWEVALFVGLVSQLVLIAVARTQFGVEGAADPHYIYVGAVYLLPLIAGVIRPVSWRPIWRPLVVGAIIVAVLSNATLLASRAVEQKELMQTENVELRVAEIFRDGPDMARDRPLDPKIMPQLTASKYYAAIDELGSPVPSSIPNSIDALPAATVDKELVSLFGDKLTVNHSARPADGTSCRTYSTGSTTATINLGVPSGQTLVLVATGSGYLSLSLGVLMPAPSVAIKENHVDAGVPQAIRLPDTGRPLVWNLVLVTSSLGEVRVCGLG